MLALDITAPNGERSGSPSPSKASGIATPPPAGTNAPSYHLRGDPFNQSIAPTAPTAEALGALVGIEVKFAQLRDQLYVELMNEFAQEEAVVLKGWYNSVFETVQHANALVLQGNIPRSATSTIYLKGAKTTSSELRSCD